MERRSDSALEIELDHFRRAGADEEEHLDVRPALEKAVDHAIELDIDVGKACEVALVDDRGGKARFGEDHHAGRRLNEMRAGARADHQEEGVLDLPVQPDDAGEAAEDLALAALLENAVDRNIRAGPGPGRQRGTADS